MISWFVWKTINRQFNQPAIVWLHLRWRGGAGRHKITQNHPKRRLIFTFGSIIFFALTLLTNGALIFSLVFPIISLMVLSPLFVGTLTGVFATSTVIGDLSRERHFNRYDLTIATPMGEPGLFWLISHIALNTAGSINGTRRMYSTLYIFAIVGTFILFGVPSLLSEGIFNQGVIELIKVYLLFAGIFVLLLIDLNQSIFVGLFTGMIAASFRIDRVTQRVMGIGIFLLLQVMTYILFFWMTNVLPSGESIMVIIALPILLFGIRELLLQIGAFILARRLEITYPEWIKTMQEYP